MGLTTLLDLLGLLFIVAGVALWVALLFLPAGVAVAGVGLLVVSWLIDARAGSARRNKS